LAGRTLAGTPVNVMTKYYPAHKAATLPRFSSINQHLRASKFEEALEAGEAAGLWQLDIRWRNVRSHGRAVWLPRMCETEREKMRSAMKSS
jgi:hypothetical protein